MTYVQRPGDGRWWRVDREDPRPVGGPVEAIGRLLVPCGRPALLDAVEGRPVRDGLPPLRRIFPLARIQLVSAFFCHHR